MNHCTHVSEMTTDVGTGEERTLLHIYGGDNGGGGWQLLEEWEVDPTSGPALAAMFVHSGLYIDDVVQMRRWNEGEEAFEDFYYHCDDLSSVRALTDEDGELVELYDYHEYGLPTITDPNTIVNGRPALLASSAFGNPFLFTGQTYDAETRLYHYRTRQYEPRMGRFISIDSIGVWGDGANLGNGYAYVGNRPGEYVDVLGYQASLANPVAALEAQFALLVGAGYTSGQAAAALLRVGASVAIVVKISGLTLSQVEQIAAQVAAEIAAQLAKEMGDAVRAEAEKIAEQIRTETKKKACSILQSIKDKNSCKGPQKEYYSCADSLNPERPEHCVKILRKRDRVLKCIAVTTLSTSLGCSNREYVDRIGMYHNALSSCWAKAAQCEKNERNRKNKESSGGEGDSCTNR